MTVALLCTSRVRRNAAFACARFAVARSRWATAARCAVSAPSRRWRGSAPLSNRFFARSCSSTALARFASAVSSVAFATATAATAASCCASISRRSIVAIVWPIATASPMSTSMRSMVPGSFGFTATRLRGARAAGNLQRRFDVADRRLHDRDVDDRGFGRGRLRCGFRRRRRRAARRHKQGRAQDDGDTDNRKPRIIPTHDYALQRERGLPRYLLPGTCTTRTWWRHRPGGRRWWR